MILMILTMSFSGILFSEKLNKIEDQLMEEETKFFATSPGHSVFGEYVGAEWCGPCMSSASPSLSNLKKLELRRLYFCFLFSG